MLPATTPLWLANTLDFKAASSLLAVLPLSTSGAAEFRSDGDPAVSLTPAVPAPPMATAAGLARAACVLQATVAHPQGGGQPGDSGIIALSPSLAFVFHTARKAASGGSPLLPATGDVVLHLGVWCAVAAAEEKETDAHDDEGWQALADFEGGALASPRVRPLPEDAAQTVLDDALNSGSGGGGGGGSCHSNNNAQRLGLLAACRVFISAPQRRMHARLHSAGHLLDLAVRQVLRSGAVPGAPPVLVATKGYHFPDGPWVEYAGTLDAAALEPFKAAVSAAAAAALAADVPTGVIELPAGDDAACAAAGFAPADTAHLSPGTVVRIVAVGDADNSCPCGGTHVKRAGDIGSLRLHKVTSKKGVVRVSYAVA